MARVRFIHAIACETWSYRPGDIREVSDADASTYLASGVAVLADPPEDEVTEPALSERAVLPRPKQAWVKPKP